jgi:DNA-binding GntR family transcriptional regulator
MKTVLEHASLPETVRRVLRGQILNNELPSGSRLVEANLAADLGVSRATIREAMRELAAEGLVEITPRKHSVVTRMSAEDREDVCFARYVLEAGLIGSVPARDRRTLDRPLSDVMDEMDKAAASGDLQALVEADIRFHGLLVEASGRRRAVELWRAINGQMGALMRSSIDRQHLDLEQVRARHEPVRLAVVEGTPRQIERAIHAHYITDGHLAPPQTSAAV